MQALDVYSSLCLEQRLAHRLFVLADRFGTPQGSGIELALKLPQKTLAHLIGSTRQRVDQIVRDFEATGLIACHYGRVTLLDMGGLTSLAASDS
ncbi:Crp/Fnr family transcriptional regulator [Rhodobacter sp. CZR27]|uniref:Crp/Fnr family transcriptional regulator n=1 Tax=Rhodobacter sp. CZR27 TaxID=2033869 RepID=UPI001E46A48D|nr:helix-turn-helix domain-containing protein [Rhodobacter sp. CZR27]